jgi:DNA-directed RNA polymerase subunit RPC12/RpoP
MLCHNCGYEWTTMSQREYVTCPNCLNKTKGGYKNEKRFKEITKKVKQ